MSMSSQGLCPTPPTIAWSSTRQGLAALREPCRVELSTDLAYVLKLLNGGRARKHLESVQRLQAAVTIHQVTPYYVRSHAGHPENERVDALAQQAASTGVGRGCFLG